VRRIYYHAIKKATGVAIPVSVLRRTGADIYTKQNAAGLLPRMGWSKAGAFNFLWMPRQLFRLK